MSIQRFGRGLEYLIILKAVQITATIIFFHIASNILTKTEMGLLATLTFLYSTQTVFSSLALPVAGAKYVAEFLGKSDKEKASAIARSILRLVLVSSSIITTIVYISFSIIASRRGIYDEMVLPVSLICFASFLAALKLTYLGLVQGLQHFDRYSIANTSTTIAYCIVGVLLVPNFKLTGFASGVLIGEIVGLTLAVAFYQGQLPKTLNNNSYKMLLKFSVPILVMQVITIVSDWADRMLFFAVSLNLAFLGIYDLAVRSSTSILVIGGFVEALALPVFSKAYGQLGNRNITFLLRKALRYLGFMFFPVSFGLASVSRTVMISLYGEAYADGGGVLAMLSISTTFLVFSGLFGSALKSIEKTKAFIKISLASLLVDAIVVLILAPFLSIVGATVARISSSFLAVILYIYELKRWMRVTVDMDGFLKGLVCSTVPAAFMFFFDRLNISSVPINLIIGGGIGIIAYVFALILLRALRNEDFHFFKQIMPKLSGIIDFIQNFASRFIV